jgi:hypothetical protein
MEDDGNHGVMDKVMKALDEALPCFPVRVNNKSRPLCMTRTA